MPWRPSIEATGKGSSDEPGGPQCDERSSTDCHFLPPRPAQSRRTVEAALGAPLESLFLSFESRPLASGSIAQVGVVQQGSHVLRLCHLLHTSHSSA